MKDKKPRPRVSESQKFIAKLVDELILARRDAQEAQSKAQDTLDRLVASRYDRSEAPRVQQQAAIPSILDLETRSSDPDDDLPFLRNLHPPPSETTQ